MPDVKVAVTDRHMALTAGLAVVACAFDLRMSVQHEQRAGRNWATVAHVIVAFSISTDRVLPSKSS